MKNRIFVSRPCPSADDWQALLAGNLPTSRIEEIEAHLDGCLVCVARLDALTPSLPEELWDAALEPATVTPEWAARCHGWTEVESPSEPADDGPLLFERKGKYKSHGPIAFGGMGEVYRAWEIGLDRWVAIKIPSRARRSPNAITRFLEEAPRQAQLEHENIVRVYARDEQDGIPFFAMELVTGETLAKASREPGLQPKRVAELIRQVATAVHCAHKIGVFHRDLKPTNIMLTADGIPKVVDFGLARTLDGPTAQSMAGGAGTDEYMAPEQWEDDPASPHELADAYGRTDVYGLGAVLYELLTGRPPFLRGAHRNETRRRVRFDEPTPPRALCKTVPRDLEAICLRCLRKRPEERFATAKDVADALDRFVNGYPPSESSLLTRTVYLIRRHRTLTTTGCAGMLLLTLVMSLFVSTRWIYQRSEALHEFEEGRSSVAEGQISAGFDRMRKAIGLLPFGETFLRQYFVRNVAALGASISPEVARLAHTSQVMAAAASPDGRYVLVGDEAGKTILWDLAENTTVALPTRPGRTTVSSVAFNQTGALCSSGDCDGDVIVWDVQSRHVLWESRLKDQVMFLGFLGDGNRLLTGALDPKGPRMRMWDVLRDGGKEILVESEDLRREVASDIVVSPAGDRFVSISVSGRCLLWEAETGQVVADLSSAAVIDAPSENRDTRLRCLLRRRLTASRRRRETLDPRRPDRRRNSAGGCVPRRPRPLCWVTGRRRCHAGRGQCPRRRRPPSDSRPRGLGGRAHRRPAQPCRSRRIHQPRLGPHRPYDTNAPALPTAAFGPAPRRSGGRHLCSQGCRSGRRLPYRDPDPPSNATRRPAKTDDGGNDRVIEVAVAGVGRPHTAPGQPNSRTPVRAQRGHHRVQPVGRYPRRRLPATRRQNDLRGRKCSRAARGNDPGRRPYVRPSGRPRVRRGGAGIYPRRRETDFGKRPAPRRGSARVDLLGTRHHVAFPLEGTVPRGGDRDHRVTGRHTSRRRRDGRYAQTAADRRRRAARFPPSMSATESSRRPGASQVAGRGDRFHGPRSGFRCV